MQSRQLQSRIHTIVHCEKRSFKKGNVPSLSVCISFPSANSGIFDLWPTHHASLYSTCTHFDSLTTMPRTDPRSHDHRGTQEKHTQPYPKGRPTSLAPSTSPNHPGPSVEGDQQLPPAQHQYGAGQHYEQHSGQHHGQPGVIPVTTDTPQTKAEQHQHWLHQQHEREQHQHQHQPGTVGAAVSALRDNSVEPQSDLPHHQRLHAPEPFSEYHVEDPLKYRKSRAWLEKERSKGSLPKKHQQIAAARAFAQAADHEECEAYYYQCNRAFSHHCRKCSSHKHENGRECRTGLSGADLEKHYQGSHKNDVLYRCYVRQCYDYNDHGWPNKNGLKKHIDFLIKRYNLQDIDVY